MGEVGAYNVIFGFYGCALRDDTKILKYHTAIVISKTYIQRIIIINVSKNGIKAVSLRNLYS